MRSSTVAFVMALVASTAVDAHITLWHPSLFGFNYPQQSSNNGPQNYGTNTMVNPLRGFDNLTTAEWFAHGALAYPPAPGNFLELTAGGNVTFELGCNRAFTTYRNPTDKSPLPQYACGTTGPLHNANKFGQKLNASLFGGTALAIAYTSDETKLKPSDMTIISINATSPWTRLVTYQIPAGLPPCPKDGCLVTWNWIHLSLNNEGYGSEIYNTLYRAKITGKTDSKKAVGVGQLPVKCEGDSTACVKGPKVPMYLWQKDGNNMFMNVAHKEENPSYNMRYGFADGAQLDVLVKGGAGRAYAAPGVAAVVAAALAVVVL